MKRLGILILSLLLSPALFAGETVPAPAATASMAATSTQTAQALIARILPGRAKSFVCEVIPQENGLDVFEIEGQGGKIFLRGNNGVALASGFNWYLKHVANCQVSSRGDQLAMPKKLPMPAAKIRKVSPYKIINHMNYCTFCYSSAFWSWEKWQREIDFMAMSGVKNPLMPIGNEIVWQSVLKKLGYSDADIAAFIPSCAFTAWWLMGNQEGEGGPVTQGMIDAESTLAKKILARMQDYGMEPVLQGFCGTVPTTLPKYLPNARILGQGGWAGGYRRPSVLSPLDPQFATVAGLWYAEHHRIYGKARYYGGDLFHEGGQSAGLDLAECAKAVQREMRKDNPAATWVLQGWSGNPPRRLLEATDPDHVVVQFMQSYPVKAGILDYAGRPWTFCMINNFGSHETLGGSLKMIASLPSALLVKDNHNNVGIGIDDEALETNPAVYDLVGDMIWEQQDVDLQAWAREFAIRRYGAEDAAAVKFWQLMASDLLGSSQAENLLFARPRFNIQSTSSWGTSALAHDLGKMLEAGRLLLSCNAKFKNQATYRNDCVEVFRQLFNDHGVQLYQRLSEAYARQDAAELATLSQEFLELLADNDKIFSAGDYTLLGKWIADARAKGATPAESDLLERSARQQITLWTPVPTDLSDYAYKQWGGLTRDYYLPRWRNFFDNAQKSLQDPKVRANFTGQAAEIAWVKATAPTYPAKPETDAAKTAKALFAKYEPRFAASVAYWKASKAEAKLWEWSLANSAAVEQTLKWDVTQKLKTLGAGTYSVRIEYQRGNKAIKIAKAELLKKTAMAVNDESISVDEHPGRSGVETKDNVYTVTVKQLDAEAQYLLQVSASGDGGNDSHGRIVISKK
jgi:alpha-N-acetylglucosaminidase